MIFLLFGALCFAGVCLEYISAQQSKAEKSVPQVRRGPATIVLQEGFELPTDYSSDVVARQSRPRGMVSEDFDIDGFPDLVSAFGDENGGYLTWHKGNAEAFAPSQPETLEGIRRGEFPAGFLADAKFIKLPVTPDFVVAGDFNRDSDPDILIAERGGQDLYLIAGDAKGNFQTPQRISVSGNITALTAGQIDLPDNLSDLVVGIENETASLLVYQNAERGIFAEPVSYSLPAPATELELGQLDDSLMKDLAILADGGVYILHGRNQREAKTMDDAARLERIDLLFSVKTLALGEFIWDREMRTEMALLSDDGMIQIIKQGSLETRPFTVQEVRERRRNSVEQRERNVPTPVNEWSGNSLTWDVAESLNGLSDTSQIAGGNAVLMKAQLSGQMADDLILVDSSAQQVKILTVDAPDKVDGEYISFGGARQTFALDVGSAPIAALPMRLNLLARPGIVVLREGQKMPTLIPSAPSATFDVDRTDDTNAAAAQVCSAAVNDCSLRGAITKANGAAGADIINIPAGTYTLTVANAGGTNEDNNARGDLDVNQDLTLMGAAAATTIIQAGTTTGNGIDKVFGLNPICSSSVSNSWSNITVRFGRNTQPNGAPDISFTGGGADYCNTGAGTLSITNSVISDNTVVNSFGGGLNISTLPTGIGAVTITGTTFNNNKTPSDTFDAKGAGIRGNGSGNLTITGSTISNNQTGTTPNIGSSALGGGIMLDQPSGAIMIHSTTISGNVAQRHGGGVAIDRPDGLATSAVTIDQGSVITGNTSNGGDTIGGGGQGGGIYANVNAAGTVTLTGITITNNVTAASATPRGGGGIASSLGSMNISFCRIFGNTSSQGTGIFKTNGGGTVTATNNWWGCSGGPGTTGCQTAVLQAAPSVLTTSPFLQLRTTAATNPLVTGQTSALTASFLTNSAGTAIAASNLGAMIGQTVTWSGIGGGISGAQTTIQPAGTATATYTATTVGAGSATAVVDGGPASGSTNTVSITVNKANTTAAIISDSPDPSNVGQNVTVAYSVAVTAPGGGTPVGNVLVSDGVNSNTCTLAAGSCVVALNTAGVRTLTATYQGDGNYNASPASAGAGHLVGTVTWTGATNSTFATNTNWNTGLAPGTGDAGIIPTGATNQPTIGSAASVSSLSVASGRILTVNNSLTVSGTLTNNGTIMGTGTIVNNFSNTGTLNPGLSPGILNITGTFANSGTMNIEIGGTGGAGVNPNGHDQLLVSGTATLGGTLNVTLTNAFTPASGNTFLILDAASSTGTFATTNLPNIAPNTWNVLYNNANGTVTLSVAAPVAAAVPISGRVATQNGTGVHKARVSLTAPSGATRTVLTSAFGYYQFEDVEVGGSYTVQVVSKRYTFAPRVIEVFDEISGLDFTAEP